MYVFFKENATTYSKDIYVITRINNNKLYIKNINNNEAKLSTYYKPYKLIKINEIQIIPIINEDVNAKKQEIHRKTKSKNKLNKKLNEEKISKFNIVAEKRIKEPKKKPK